MTQATVPLSLWVDNAQSAGEDIEHKFWTNFKHSIIFLRWTCPNHLVFVHLKFDILWEQSEKFENHPADDDQNDHNLSPKVNFDLLSWNVFKHQHS